VNTPSSYVPVIIVGAGRSGTKMLRDVLCALPEFGTWPCDEINFVWRHGNARFPSDEFPRALATDYVRRYIRRQFDRLAHAGKLRFAVEKTCANSLRVGFVHEVFPDAKFVHIIRDGRDVSASAAIRWNAPLNIPYLLRKARFVPPMDFPYYAGRYFYNRIYRLLAGRERLAFWGPRYAEMGADVRENSVPVACAHQWRRCVDASLEGFREVLPDNVVHILYEDFVAAPAEHLWRIVAFLGATIAEDDLQHAVRGVSTRSIGRWKEKTSVTDQVQIEQVVEPTLKKLEQFHYTPGL
jgi:hypothetical protein